MTTIATCRLATSSTYRPTRCTAPARHAVAVAEAPEAAGGQARLREGRRELSHQGGGAVGEVEGVLHAPGRPREAVVVEQRDVAVGPEAGVVLLDDAVPWVVLEGQDLGAVLADGLAPQLPDDLARSPLDLEHRVEVAGRDEQITGGARLHRVAVVDRVEL